MVRDIVDGTSNISCNFPTDNVMDDEVLAEIYPRGEMEWGTEGVRHFDH